MHINKDNWDYETLYEKRKDLVKVIETFFGDKISNITIQPLDPDYPDNKVGIEYNCILYKNFYVKFYALRGFDFKVMQNESVGISLGTITSYEYLNEIPMGLEKATIERILSILRNHLEMQLPDKYLKHYGWL